MNNNNIYNTRSNFNSKRQKTTFSKLRKVIKQTNILFKLYQFGG